MSENRAVLKPGTPDRRLRFFRNNELDNPLYPSTSTVKLQSLDILALTAWVLDFDGVNGNGQRILEQINAECKVRLLLVSRLTYAFWAEHRQSMDEKVRNTQELVAKFMAQVRGTGKEHLLEVREHPWQPSVSLVLLDARKETGVGWVAPFTPNPRSDAKEKFYFEINAPQDVFKYYCTQFEQLWVEAHPYSQRPNQQQMQDLQGLTHRLRLGAARLSGIQKDMAVIFALQEELDYFLDIFEPEWRSSSNVKTMDTEGIFEIQVETVGSKRHVLLMLLGQMGKTTTAAKVENLLGRYQVDVLVSIGVTGGLKDVRIGDVLVASQVDDYMHRGKSKAAKDLAFGGVVYRSTATLVRRAGCLRYSRSKDILNWEEQCSGARPKAETDEKFERPIFHPALDSSGVGPPRIWADDVHIASGDIVVASHEFQTDLAKRDRNLMAVEMESVGLLTAVAENAHDARTLILRGISDLADADKEKVEKVYGGGLRRYALQNAARFLRTLLLSDILYQSETVT